MIVTFKKQLPLDSSLDDFMIAISKIDSQTKQLVEFSVLQITNYHDKIYQIIKYDTEHGHCHVHRYYRNLNALEAVGKEISSKTFYECRKDIMQNWRNYKRKYLERWLEK